ncbi:hypothetical protein [Nitrosospira sp. Nl5]|uniref:hypothetical protein n=1 Tax=Nitrosospira sp. Nl5 TaxID=200120 RepID=UPI00210C197E|nr:hypothetical protein [Nitrosospira sp. Nl5]
MMKARNTIVSLPLFCLLAGWSAFSIAAGTAEAPDTRPASGNAAPQSDPKAVVKSYEDESSKMHEAVAKHYEDVAKELQAKIQEQKQLLAHYEDKSYLYGRRAQDLQAHADALVRKYEEAAKANLKEAALHRQMASKIKENSGKSS